MADKLAFVELGSHFIDRNENKVKVMQVTGGPLNAAAFMYECVLNLDKDGAGNTYGWNNPGGENTAHDTHLQEGLDPKDGLGNACGTPGSGVGGYQSYDAGGHDFYWSSLVSAQLSAASATLVLDTRRRVEANRASKNGPVLPEGQGFFPVVQRNGAYKGYYISTTATAADASLPETNPDHWVNGLTVPYAVRSGEWDNWKIGGKTVRLGDYGLAINPKTGQHSGFVFGDTPGGGRKVGEVSGKLWDLLGKTDGYEMCFIVFPGSGNGPVLGRDPEKSVPLKVFPWSLDLCLAPNSIELPQRLAAGPTMTIPASGKMNGAQTANYNNIVGALRRWGIWPGSFWGMWPG